MSNPMDAPDVNCWLIPLRGHSFDLEDLPFLLHASDVRVSKRRDGFYLVLPVEVVGPSHEPIAALAKECVALVNGAASLLIDSYRPIEVAHAALLLIDDRGRVARTVVPVGLAEERNKAGRIDVSVGGVPDQNARRSLASKLLNSARDNRAATDALALVGRSSPTWSELYLVYEIVESNAGRRMFDEGWIKRSEARSFNRTANSYTALGRTGRHGRHDRGNPPAAPMSQGQATRIMRSLVLAWLTSSGK